MARRLIACGMRVTATTREVTRLGALLADGATVVEFAVNPSVPGQIPTTLVDKWDVIIYSIPTLRTDAGMVEPAPELLRTLGATSKRCIYLSTTGVYGRQEVVDASTVPSPETPRERLRIAAEAAVIENFGNALVLRPAAIYGPGRGVHASLRAGRYRLTGNGTNYISRIHVDDLAAHVVAACQTELTGAWPVADEHPCTQREMAEYCAKLLGLPVPPSIVPGETSETLRANRRVDGSAVREALGIALQYPSYREGVPAAITAETQANDQQRKLRS
ncbi:MAG: NAD-dependent epimerase/dehydratase family protein [Bryobacterales bacterium]|nr:NAD-dependent epimerase/dehydratase family protein [Bryobacterales bacterium]